LYFTHRAAHADSRLHAKSQKQIGAQAEPVRAYKNYIDNSKTTNILLFNISIFANDFKITSLAY